MLGADKFGNTATIKVAASMPLLGHAAIVVSTGVAFGLEAIVEATAAVRDRSIALAQ